MLILGDESDIYLGDFKTGDENMEIMNDLVDKERAKFK